MEDCILCHGKDEPGRSRIMIYGFAHQDCVDGSVYKLRPIETAPRDGTWILLFGPSGMTTTPLRATVGHYDPKYRPKNPWQTHSNDAFTDGGDPPTHWIPLPEIGVDA